MSVEDTLLAAHNAEIGGASRPDSSPFMRLQGRIGRAKFLSKKSHARP